MIKPEDIKTVTEGAPNCEGVQVRGSLHVFASHLVDKQYAANVGVLSDVERRVKAQIWEAIYGDLLDASLKVELSVRKSVSPPMVDISVLFRPIFDQLHNPFIK